MIFNNKKYQSGIVVVLIIAIIAGAAATASAIPELPAQLYGTVKDSNGNPVPWEEITATMNVGGGVIVTDSLFYDSAGDFYRDGQYGMLDGQLTPEVPRLLVSCPDGGNCAGKKITFKVTSGGVTYTAVSSPASVSWVSDAKLRVDLTVDIAPPPPGVAGNVKLEKINQSDPEPDHAGIVVKVKQGAVTRTAYPQSNGNYVLTDEAFVAGSCTVEFDYPEGAWKKETRSANLSTQGTTQLSAVTLLIGDMDNNGLINLQDLLWMSSKIGTTTTQSQYADVNNDGKVNILDMLRVRQNIN
ncbi:MAG: hypothetical protein A4E53_04124 [Pelotomaculum sp. PtaB.Bin104]|nr:MAG: hypothetical protein A4E53_04124 [Pelotomaculum sp. PtaB.Bin104]